MLECEGYKMCYGTGKIVPNPDWRPPFEETGTWLYKPEYKCWYCNGSSYPEDIVAGIKEDEE